MTDDVAVRAAVPDDAVAIGSIWWNGWRDGHIGNVPHALVELRTHESFERRARERIEDVIVATDGLEVAGFVMVDHDELEQVYVAADHRGTSVAERLLAAGESIVAGRGFAVAWLAVVEGNARARRFYERCGWTNSGPLDYVVEDRGTRIEVPTLRYEKRLNPTQLAQI
jgi:ribosomal protein S18 acetylase RimI-like enzyme